MRVAYIREKEIDKSFKKLILRQVDMIFEPSEAKNESLQDLCKRIERNLNYNRNDIVKFGILKVYINEAKKVVTVVFKDGTKQRVKCSPEDSFDPYIGFSLALTKKLFCSKSQVKKFINNNSVVIKEKQVDKTKNQSKKKINKEEK